MASTVAQQIEKLLIKAKNIKCPTTAFSCLCQGPSLLNGTPLQDSELAENCQRLILKFFLSADLTARIGNEKRTKRDNDERQEEENDQKSRITILDVLNGLHESFHIVKGLIKQDYHNEILTVKDIRDVLNMQLMEDTFPLGLKSYIVDEAGVQFRFGAQIKNKIML